MRDYPTETFTLHVWFYNNGSGIMGGQKLSKGSRDSAGIRTEPTRRSRGDPLFAALDVDDISRSDGVRLKRLVISASTELVGNL